MIRLPLRERILNAFSSGFAADWIAKRFECSKNTVHFYISMARAEGDERARYVAQSTIDGLRRRSCLRKSAHPNLAEADRHYDDFPELPEVSEPILPFGGKVPQSVNDAP